MGNKEPKETMIEQTDETDCNEDSALWLKGCIRVQIDFNCC